MSDEQKFLDAVVRFGQEFLRKNPGMEDLVESARAGTMDPKDAVKEIWKAAAKNRGFRDNVEKALFDAFQIEPGSTDLAHFPERQNMLDRWGFEEADLVFQPFDDRPDYKMLHPLLMGMIVELIQFDGDIPELRTGRLPAGAKAAVPVASQARDPVTLGAMLRTASQEVTAEIRALEKAQDQKVAGMIEAVGDESGGAISAIVRQESERALAVPGYQPGQKAQIREVKAPTGVELMAMPFKERQELAHQALTSTQGRRSAIPVISQLIYDSLVSMLHGLTIASTHRSDPFADVEWVMQIDGGVNERNPNFNFIDTAAKSLKNKLSRELEQRKGMEASYELVVTPINTVSERRVGWRAALYRS